MTVNLLALTLVTTVGAPPPGSAVVALGDAAELADAVQAYVTFQRAAGRSALPAQTLFSRLVGAEAPQDADIGALEALLQDARLREANFDTVGANRMRRDVLNAFDRALHTSSKLRAVAAAAAQDIAAALLGEGKSTEAVRAAEEALRRFADTPLDTLRHAPPVHALFDRVSRSRKSHATGTVKVITDRHGHVYLDGMYLGRASSSLTKRVPVGAYRLWLVDDQGSSLPYPVRVSAGSESRVRISKRLDARLSFGQVLGVRCSKTCSKDLSVLGRRLGVRFVFGVRPPGAAVDDNDDYEVLQVKVGSETTTELTFDPTQAPCTVAIVPPLPTQGADPWISYFLADVITRGLLVHAHLDMRSKKHWLPPGVVTWQQTIAEAAEAGIDITQPVSRTERRRLLGLLGADTLFFGSYEVQGSSLTVDWQLHGIKPRVARVMVMPAAEVGVRADLLLHKVIAALGASSRDRGGHHAIELPLDVARHYGEGLRILSRAPLPGRGRIPLKRWELNEAYRHFEQATRAAPQFQQAWVERGVVSVLQRESERAEQEFAKGLMLAGELEPFLAMGLHQFYREKGDHQEAVRILADAVAKHPGFLLGRQVLEKTVRWQSAR